MRLLPLITALVIAGCATVPEERLSVDEAFRAQAPSVQRVSAAEVRDRDLHDRLTGFSEGAERMRQGVVRGSAMPTSEVDAWTSMLATVDAFLAAPVQGATPFDAARARLVLQAELTADGQTYGDVPGELAERVAAQLVTLSQRVALAAERARVKPSLFFWPVSPLVVTSAFGDRIHPFSGENQFHAGTDLLADLAQPVHAAWDGTVVFSGWQGGYGKEIELQHDAHTSTRYGHLRTALVAAGTRVKKGDVIGLAGSTGVSTGVHVHFEVRQDGVPLDPESQLSSTAVFTGLRAAIR